MSEAKLSFVRHGQSESNARIPLERGNFCSLNPLTELGTQQVISTGEKLGSELQDIPATSIQLFSSPLLRALQTAENVRQTINLNRPENDQIHEITIDNRLMEQQWGILEPEYLDSPIITGLYAAFQQTWRDAQYIHHPILPETAITDEIREVAQQRGLPENKIRGESMEDMTNRTNSWLVDNKEKIEQEGMHTIVFGHGNQIRSTLPALGIATLDELGEEMRDRDVRVPNASVTTYTRRENKWELEKWAEVPEVEALAA